MDPPTKPALGPKQAAFVAEYLVDLNATQAAIRAGYSRNSAESQGARLLTNAKVRAAVDAAMALRAERVEVKQDDVLRELLRVARTDISDAFDDKGRFRDFKDMPVDLRRAISSVETLEEFEGGGDNRVQTGQTRKVKFWDKVKALELLGKHLKLWTDKHEHAGEGGGPLQVIVQVIGDDE